MKKVLTKEKIDRQLSGQSGATTPFMKVGDVDHLNKMLLFNAHDLIREQLENLTSMVYNMSVNKEDNNRPFKPHIHQKKRRGKIDRILVIEIEIDHTVGTDKDKTLDPTIGDNYKTDSMHMIVGEEVIDVKFMTIAMTVEIEGDKTLGEASVMTDTTIEIGVEQEKEV